MWTPDCRRRLICRRSGRVHRTLGGLGPRHLQASTGALPWHAHVQHGLEQLRIFKRQLALAFPPPGVMARFRLAHRWANSKIQSTDAD
jgi:hypothetical protein